LRRSGSTALPPSQATPASALSASQHGLLVGPAAGSRCPTAQPCVPGATQGQPGQAVGPTASGWEPTGIGAADGSTKTEEAAEEGAVRQQRLECRSLQKAEGRGSESSSERERVSAARGPTAGGSEGQTGASVTGTTGRQGGHIAAALRALSEPQRKLVEARSQLGAVLSFRVPCCKSHVASEALVQGLQHPQSASWERCPGSQDLLMAPMGEKTSTGDSERTAGPLAPAAAGAGGDGGLHCTYCARCKRGWWGPACTCCARWRWGRCDVHRTVSAALLEHAWLSQAVRQALTYLLAAPALRFVDLPRYNPAHALSPHFPGHQFPSSSRPLGSAQPLAFSPSIGFWVMSLDGVINC